VIYLGGGFYDLVKEAKKVNYIYKHAALLVAGNRIISRGHNYAGCSKKYLRLKWNMKDTHAEVDAITRRDRKRNGPKGDTIIVIRFYKGRLLNSKPCYSCQAFMRFKGIKKVIYSDKNGKLAILKL